MDIDLLRYSLLGSLTVYGPEYAIAHLNINPVVTSARIDNIFTIRYPSKFSFEFIFDLDSDNLDFKVKFYLGSHENITTIHTPMDCHNDDMHIMFNRLIESCFLNLSIEYNKTLDKQHSLEKQ